MTYEERKKQIATAMAEILFTDFNKFRESGKQLIIKMYEREADICISFGRYCYEKGHLQGSVGGKSKPEQCGLVKEEEATN